MTPREYLSIVDKHGVDYIYRQLAEECAELAQAALKLIRAERGETQMSYQTAHALLLDEIADVQVMLGLMRRYEMSGEDRVLVATMERAKEQRMVERLL